MHSHFGSPTMITKNHGQIIGKINKKDVGFHLKIMALVSMLNSKHYSRGMARVAQIFLAIDHNPRGCKAKGDC